MKPLKIYLLQICHIVLMMTAYGQSYQNPTLQAPWPKYYNGAGSGIDEAKAITSDASGNVYVTGYTDIDPGSNVNNGIVTIKYNKNGGVVWVSTPYSNGTAGSQDFEMGEAIAVDGSGIVYAAGVTKSSVAADNFDISLLKYSATGTLLWVKLYATVSSLTETPQASAIALSGSNIYVSGTNISSGNSTGVVLAYNSAGTNIWNYVFPGVGGGNDLKVNAGYIYAVGSVINASTIGLDCYTVKLSASNGSMAWQRYYNNPSQNYTDQLNALHLSSGGYVYAAGVTSNNSPTNLTDGLVLCYDPNGLAIWPGIASIYNSPYGLRDEFLDITGMGTDCNGTQYELVYPVGFIVTGNQTAHSGDKDYVVAAYRTTNGTLSPCWPTNPRNYDGAGSGISWGGGEQAGDVAYAAEYSSNGNRLFVSGHSLENTSTPDTWNITTIRYDGATGSQQWIHSYDDVANAPATFNENMMSNKNQLDIRYNACFLTHEIHIAAKGYIQSPTDEKYNYLTLKYKGVVDYCQRISMQEEGGSNIFYPNPFADYATLKLIWHVEMGNSTLYIYDSFGRIAFTMSDINTNEVLIKRGALIPGTYFYRVMNNDGLLTSGKFMIID